MADNLIVSKLSLYLSKIDFGQIIEFPVFIFP